MKDHIGVDADSGLVQSVVGSGASVEHVMQAGALLDGGEEDAFGDTGYSGVRKRSESAGRAWHAAMGPGSLAQAQPLYRTRSTPPSRSSEPRAA